MLAGLGLLVLGCRVENPAFLGPETGAPTTGSTDPKFPGDTSSEKGPGPESESTTSQPGEPTGAPGSDSSATSDPGEELPTGQDFEAAKVFCEGAAICFPIHRLAPGGVVQDLGPSGLSIDFAQSVALERNWAEPPPLDHSVRLNAGSAGMVSQSLALGSNREVGFDIWFSPEDVNSRNWTLFEIDNLLAIERMSTGGLRCALKNGLVDVGPAINPSFEPGVLYHVTCALSGERIKMWWGKESVPYALPLDSGSETSFSMRLGASPNNDRDPFLGRVAGLRIWNDVEQMRLKNNLPKQLIAPAGG